MNPYQATWWEQARSDLRVFDLLRRDGLEPCHQLHYLQMVAEKLTKAYLWRDGSPPSKKHAGFVNFLRGLGFVENERHRRRFAARGRLGYDETRGGPVMPTVLRAGPYRAYFYSHDLIEPPHVHVDRDDLSAKFWLEPVALACNLGFKSNELRTIERLLTENQAALMAAWRAHAGGEA